MEKEMIKYNELPVITFRWLKANDITLEKIRKEDTFTGEYILSGKENVKTVKDINALEKYYPESLYDYKGSNIEEISYILKNAAHIHLIESEEKEAKVRLSYDLKNENLVEVNMIVAKEGQTVNIITDYTSEEAEIAASFNILKAESNSIINIVRINRLSINTRNMDQRYSFVEANGKVNYISIDLGARENVINYVTDLMGEESSASLKDVYMGDGNRIIDMYHLINHHGKKCLSDMEVRGALKDKAKKYFRGTLDFKKGSTGSEGSELESVMLMDETVKSVAVPLLLCGEDDVIGNHAASAGQIDEEKLFYIMSRGFSESDARRIIVESEFRPIIDMVDDEDLKESILDSIHKMMDKVE